MRKTTLAAIAYILCFLPYLAREFADSDGKRFLFGLPLSLVALILMPVFLLLLNWVNKYILAWRKERGRDIEEEEKYENDNGFISLISKDDSKN
jgi:hypothetical protein